jgi:hypothetical protein
VVYKNIEVNMLFSSIVKIVLGFVLCSTNVYAQDMAISFDKANTIYSPSHIYMINHTLHEVYYDDPRFYECEHSLFIKNVQTNKVRKLYKYNRFVTILWSRDEKNLAVIDYGGSDFANCLIFPLTSQLNKPIKPISIFDELKQQMPTNKTIFKQVDDPDHLNHHVYITCNKWLNTNTVLIKIYGYGDFDPNGFTLWYKYTLGKKFEFIKKEASYSE